MEGLSPFDWRVMTEAIVLLPKPPTLLQQLFFSTRRTHTAEHIDFDKVWGERKILPFVSKVAGGTIVQGTKRAMHTVQAPRLRPKMPFRAADLLGSRASGSPIYSVGASNPAQALEKKIALELQHLRNRVDYTIEYYCAQALTGAVIVSQPDVEYHVDYLMPADHKVLLTSGSLWSDDGVDPGEDLQAWADQIIDATGMAPDVAVMGTSAADRFVKNPAIKEELDNRRIEAGNLSPSVQSLYVGTYKGIDIYRYGGSVTDEYGNSLSFWNPNRVCLGVSSSPCSVEFGLILDLDAEAQVEGEYFVKSWTEKDPSVRWVLAESRPLPVPMQPEAFVDAYVL